MPSLETCSLCGAGMKLHDGTAPKECTDGFEETYVCQNGHVGTYEVRYGSNQERFSGACA